LPEVLIFSPSLIIFFSTLIPCSKRNEEISPIEIDPNNSPLSLAKDNGELFGSISIGDISSFLLEQGISVEKKMIKLGEKIKTSGNHKVDIDLHPEISCSLNIDILSPKSSL
jgi:hypothetical protein